MMMVGLWVVLFVISFHFFFLQPSLELLSLSHMMDFSYHCCHRCSVIDNQIHYHSLHYTVILLPTDHIYFYH
jgi:hypothetical protein